MENLCLVKRVDQQLIEIIRDENIRTVYQPIVSLIDGGIKGYEALSRGPAGSCLERPDVLFKAAEDNGMLWELEYLCRMKAIERAHEILPNTTLFINVDPRIIKHPKFKSGFTRDFMKKNNMNPSNIVFEITEKSAIEDFKSFRRTLNHYIDQGYQIAIDDIGAGYSGLRMLAETHPQFIKIDMELIRDIDKKSLNQSLVKTLVSFGTTTNIKVIAEGIETIDELNTLIDLGVEYGQGYLMQKPSSEFLTPSLPIIKVIAEKQRRKEQFFTQTTSSLPIGEIARFDKGVGPSTKSNVIYDIFNTNPAIYGIPVVDNEKPVGLVMRNSFYANLSTQYGVAVFMNRNISLLMNKHPLIVDYKTPIAQVTKLALGRREEDLYHYIIISKDDKYYGVTTVKNLLECTTQLELNKARHSNPLTALPGNIIIEERIRQALDEGEDCCFVYFDIDNFKAYNDVYGFEKGDTIIVHLADAIKGVLHHLPEENYFLGHIGGDDFIAILHTERVWELCNLIVSVFDEKVPQFYREEDQKNKFIVTQNRKGELEKYPFVSLSISILNSKKKSFTNVYELSEGLSSLKKQCKRVSGSCICMD